MHLIITAKDRYKQICHRSKFKKHRKKEMIGAANAPQNALIYLSISQGWT